MIHSIWLKTKFEVLDSPAKILAFRSCHTWYTVAVKLSLREKLTKLLPCQDTVAHRIHSSQPFLKEFVLWDGKNFFKNCCYISFQARMDPNLRFCSRVLALSFNEKEKKALIWWYSCYNLSHYRCYRPPQILSNAIMDFLDLSHEKKVKVE